MTAMTKFTAPATEPFQNVLRAGVIPSMSAERWLSIAQHVHASSASDAAINPGRPASPDSRALAATTPATPTHDRPLKCS